MLTSKSNPRWALPIRSSNLIASYMIKGITQCLLHDKPWLWFNLHSNHWVDSIYIYIIKFIVLEGYALWYTLLCICMECSYPLKAPEYRVGWFPSHFTFDLLYPCFHCVTLVVSSECVEQQDPKNRKGVCEQPKGSTAERRKSGE